MSETVLDSDDKILAIRFRAERFYFPYAAAFSIQRTGDPSLVVFELWETDENRYPGRLINSASFVPDFVPSLIHTNVAWPFLLFTTLEEGSEYILSVRGVGLSGSDYIDIEYGDIIARLTEETLFSDDAGDSWVEDHSPLLFLIFGDLDMSWPIVLDEILIGKKYNYPFVRQLQWLTDVVSYNSQAEQANQRWRTPKRTWTLLYELLTHVQRQALQSVFERSAGRFNTYLFRDPEDYSAVCSFLQDAKAVTAVTKEDAVYNQFTISGKYARDFPTGRKFNVSDSTSNDGTYTVKDSYQTYDTSAGTTVVTTEETIPSATVDGNILYMEFDLVKVYNSGEAGQFTEYKKDLISSSLVVEVDDTPKTRDVNYSCVDTDGVVKFASDSVPLDGEVIDATFEFYFRVRNSSDSMSFGQDNFRFSTSNTLVLEEVKRTPSQT